ncbi:MAG: hypothetical protein AABP62_13250 [Planctomycetota bacterium]
MSYFLQMAKLTLSATVTWLTLTGALLLLPGVVSIACLFVGLVLFLIGAELHYKLPAAVGGVLMFAGVFAAALLGALG